MNQSKVMCFSRYKIIKQPKLCTEIRLVWFFGVFNIFVNSATMDWTISLLMLSICFEMTCPVTLNSLFSNAISVWKRITIRRVVQEFWCSAYKVKSRQKMKVQEANYSSAKIILIQNVKCSVIKSRTEGIYCNLQFLFIFNYHWLSKQCLVVFHKSL